MRANSARTLMTAGFAALQLAGCAHVAHEEDFGRFAEATGKVHAQADLSFARANDISRQAAIDAFVESRRPGISERSFPPAIDADSIAAWDAAFSDLERYGSLLATLLDGRGPRATDAAAALGHELEAGRAGVRIQPRVGAGFAALAGILVEGAARRSAHDIMRQADPAVRRTLEAMADAVGRDRTEGLQAVVWSNWTASLGDIRDQYAKAAEQGDAGRQRSIAAQFLTGVDHRDADLAALASLRASLLALADAHSAAVAGSPASQAAVLGELDRRLDEAKRNMDLLRGGAK